MSKVETIACQCGNIFAASVVEHIDTAWKINREVYRLQGCVISETDTDKFKFSGEKDCCEQRKNLFHIDELLDEFKEEIEDDFDSDYDDDDDTSF